MECQGIVGLYSSDCVVGLGCLVPCPSVEAHIHNHIDSAASILLPIMLFPDPSKPATIVDLAEMESVFGLFALPDVFFCGWVHYLAFDLLVARGLAIDAVQACSVSYLTYYIMVVPCLLCTLYVGPVGYLMYTILRVTVLAPAKGTINSGKKDV
jgi:Domain of unknown function (DUF4281)